MALDYYMKKFREIYPTGPKVSEVFSSYQKALEGIPEFLVDIACEQALKTCKYFPTPAEIRALVPDQDKFTGTSSFDLSADFVPVREWYEKFSDTQDLHFWADNSGRKKVSLVPCFTGRKLENWPQHWDKDKVQPISWEEARKRIGNIAKGKSL